MRAAQLVAMTVRKFQEGNSDAVCRGVCEIAGVTRRCIALLLSQNDSFGLSIFACLDALVPRVLNFCIRSGRTISKPRTATSASTEFAGFLDGAACQTPKKLSQIS